MIPNKPGIYRIVNLVNGKCYVGHTSNLKQRKNDHYKLLRHNKHKNNHLQDAWNLYGEINFIFEILEIIEYPLDFVKNRKQYAEYLCPYEQKWIDYYNAADGDYGYNEAPVSKSLLGYKHKPDVIEANRQRQLNRPPITEETRDKHRKSLIKYYQENSVSEGAKQNLREAILGVPKSKEHVNNMILSRCTKRYIFTSPEGYVYPCKHRNRFCIVFNISSGEMSKLLSNTYNYIKGWTGRYMTPEEEARWNPHLQGDILWVKVNKEGDIIDSYGLNIYLPLVTPLFLHSLNYEKHYFIINSKLFCDEFYIIPRGLSQLLKGNRKHTKGWAGSYASQWLVDKVKPLMQEGQYWVEVDLEGNIIE